MKNNYLNIFLISGSGIIGGLLNYIYHPIMLKYLTLSEFGEFGSLVGIFNILGVFVGGFTYFLTREISKNLSDLGKVKTIFLESLKILGFIGIFSYIMFILLSPFIGNFLGVENLLLYLIGINIIFSFFGAGISAILMGYKKFYFLGFFNILTPFFKLILGFILVYLGFSVYGAVFGFILSGILGFLISFFYILNLLKNYKYENNFNGILKDFLNSKLSIINFFFTTLFFAVIMNIDVILAKNIFSSETAGVYAGLSVLGKFLIFLLLSIETVYFGQIMEFKKENLPKHFLINPLVLIFLAGVSAIVINLIIGGFILSTLKPELVEYKNYYILILIYYFLIAFISFLSKILIGWGNHFINYIMGFLSIFLVIIVYLFGNNDLSNFIYSFILTSAIGVILIGIYFIIVYKSNKNNF